MSITAEQLIEQYKNVPLSALNISVRNKLGAFLNIECEFGRDYPADYQGLAEVIGFDYQDIKNFQRHRQPTQEVLYQWGTRPELSPTVDNLIRHLQTIGRADDVITECAHLIKKDCEKYKQYSTDIQTTQGMIERPAESCSPTVSSRGVQDNSETLGLVNIDINLEDDPLLYDAFVIYNPTGKDLNFVKDLADKLEAPPHNLKLFIPWRDDLPGSSRHEISAHMIATRCRRTLVILSKNFLKSASADFQLKFAHCLSPGARSRRVIPVYSEPCEIPSILRPVTTVDLTDPEMIDWTWPRLLKALRRPLTLDPRDGTNPAELEQLKLNAGNTSVRSWWTTGVLSMNFPDKPGSTEAASGVDSGVDV